VALYQPDNDVVYVNSKVWGPNNPAAIQLFSRDERVSSIANADIVAAMRQMFEGAARA